MFNISNVHHAPPTLHCCQTFSWNSVFVDLSCKRTVFSDMSRRVLQPRCEVRYIYSLRFGSSGSRRGRQVQVSLWEQKWRSVRTTARHRLSSSGARADLTFVIIVEIQQHHGEQSHWNTQMIRSGSLTQVQTKLDSEWNCTTWARTQCDGPIWLFYYSN